MSTSLASTDVLLVDCQSTGANPQRGHLLEAAWARGRAGAGAWEVSSHLVRLPRGKRIPPLPGAAWSSPGGKLILPVSSCSVPGIAAGSAKLSRSLPGNRQAGGSFISGAPPFRGGEGRRGSLPILLFDKSE